MKLELRPNTAIAIKEVETFLNKTRIPTKDTHRVFYSIDKLLALHENWEKLKKCEKQQSEIRERREREFLDSLDGLFDIVHPDVLNIIIIEEDKLFLLN